ncbi:hypothetical protein [Legionella sp. km772]|uniref:hypothetical protein n=1 Tax=Legionella sp. km772 TaxID=2498111 RepID=UPI000F8D5CF1|nr:hypothetical protein [Legionella sp. km772]RUR07204.1 hypothetical protein ELY15_12465 [Legionella sp. km772]
MSVPASKVPLPQTPMHHVVFLIVANQANSDDNLADISMALAKTGKEPGTFAHLDSLPVQVGPQVLKPLNAPNKQLILLGHVGNHSMGGHTCSALADMLVQKGLPQDSKHPIPILVLGCQPSKQGLQGLENIGAELLMELTKRRVNATTLSFDPSAITYTTDTDPRESKEWITTYFSHSLSAKGITWVFSGIPQCYREIKERLELDLQACRTKTTALKAESEHNKALISAKETELSALQGDLNSVTSKIQALELEKQQIWREARTIQDRIAGGRLQASAPTQMATSTAVVLAGLQPSPAPLSLQGLFMTRNEPIIVQLFFNQQSTKDSVNLGCEAYSL